MLSCAQFRRAPFSSGINEFSTADEYMNSPQVHRESKGQVRGPFQLQWPVRKAKINRGFSTGRDEHFGLDIGGRKNQTIYSAHDGTVVYAGSGFRGYGKMILIEYDSNWASLYGHLNRIEVKMGQKVLAGQVIGKMGRTGRATGVHLHFELIKGKQPVDPLPYLRDKALITDI